MAENEKTEQRDIVRLDARRTELRRQHVDRIEAYWREVRGARLVPSRIDIDPRGLSGVLSNAFVLERIATGMSRFRIAGSHLSDLMGLDIKGLPLSAIFVPEARQSLADALKASFDDPSIIRLQLSAEDGFGRPEMTGDMVLMPLRSDLGEVSRLLGGVCMHGTVGRAPRRLRIEAQTREGLTGFADTSRTVHPEPQAAQSRPTNQAKDGSLRRGHLELVVDNSA